MELYKHAKIFLVLMIISALGVSVTIKNKFYSINLKTTPQVNTQNYEKEKINVTYPQLSNLNDMKVQSNINELINNIVFKYFNEDSNDLSLEIDYEIMFLNNKIISIKFYGWYYEKNGLPYPVNVLEALTYDLLNNRIIKLDQIISIDEEIIQYFYNGKAKTANEQNASAFKEYLEIAYRSEEELINAIQRSNFYLTNDSIIIVFSTVHAIGDYEEFIFKIEDIKDSILLKWYQ
jgi:hypothetical protein